jgi:NAD(P)-dependent dehydrogenase (short-subunit alcohol dehydrogenase family)
MTLPSFSLEGKTCVVTGAARGLGKEFLTAFALSGARGACVDLSLQGSKDSIKHITEHIASQPSTSSSYAPDLRAYACNVTSESQVQDTWASIVSDFGKVDVVVTAAGIVDNVEAENYAYDRWKKMIDINLNGSFLFAREAGKYWIEQKMKGNLILVSSMSSIICVRPQKQAAYNAVSYTRLLRCMKQPMTNGCILVSIGVTDFDTVESGSFINGTKSCYRGIATNITQSSSYLLKISFSGDLKVLESIVYALAT